MPFYSHALPAGDILAALEAWWGGAGPVCAAGCLPPHPTQLVLTPNTLRYQSNPGLIGRVTDDLAGAIRGLVMFRWPDGRIERAAATPNWVDIWRAEPWQPMRTDGYQTGFANIIAPPHAARPPKAECEPLGTSSPLIAGRTPIAVAIPQGLLTHPGAEIVVNLEGSYAEVRDLRADRQLGTTRAEVPLLSVLAFGLDYRSSALGLAPIEQADARCTTLELSLRPSATQYLNVDINAELR